MATKKELLKEAKATGLVAADADEEGLSVADLERLLGRGPAWEGSLSSKDPIVAADGHVVLSQEDIDARQ